MSVPVIGACLCGLLLATSLRSSYVFLSRAPSAGEGNGCEANEESIDSLSESSESSSFPEHLKKEWPDTAQRGSGFTKNDLETLRRMPPGSVLWKHN